MNIDLGQAQNQRGKNFPCRSLFDFCVLSHKKMCALYFCDECVVFQFVLNLCGKKQTSLGVVYLTCVGDNGK